MNIRQRKKNRFLFKFEILFFTLPKFNGKKKSQLFSKTGLQCYYYILIYMINFDWIKLVM